MSEPNTTPDPDEGGQTPDTGNGGGDANQVIMTQEALNAAFAERADRASRNAIADLLNELGVNDTEALGEIIESHNTRQREMLSEQEQLQTDLEEARTSLQESQEQLEAARTNLETYMLQTAVRLEAQKGNFLSEALDDIWILVRETEELSSLLEADTEKLEVTGAKDVIDKVAELRPHWLEKQTSGLPRGRGGKPPQTPSSERKEDKKRPLVQF